MPGTVYGPFDDTSIPFIDGTGTARNQFASQGILSGSTLGNTPWMLLADPDTGIRAGSLTPYPAAPPAIAPQHSTSLEAARLFNSAGGAPGACTLFGFVVNATNTAGWVLLYDAAAIPVDGAVLPVKAWQLPANTSLDWRGSPIKLNNGCALVFSSSGPFFQTSSASAAFSAEVQ